MPDLPVRELLKDRIWRNGALIVLCLISVLLLSSQSAASYGTYFLAISMLVAFTAWKDVFQVRLCLLIVVLIGYLSLSAFWSEPFVLRDFFSVALRGLLTFLFVVALAECQLRGQVQRWLGRAFAVVGFVAVVAAIAIFYLEAPQDGRLNGLGQLDTHVVAALVWSVLMVFSLQLIAQERVTAWRLLGWLSLFGYSFAIFLSDSRTAWVAGTLGLATYFLAINIKSVRRFVLIGVIVSVSALCLVAVAWFVPGLSEIAFPRGGSFRLEIWQASLDRISQASWLFGLGVLSSDDFFIGGMTFAHSHNMYLSVTYQGGLIALTLFLSLIAGAVIVFLRSYAERDAKVGLGILTVAVAAYCLDGHELVDKVGDTWMLFWLPIGLALGLAWNNSYRRLIR